MRRLSEVVDFEVLLVRDGETARRDGKAALLVRDRTLGAKLDGPAHRRLGAWVELRRAAAADLPGARAASIVRLFTLLLMGLGVVIGAAAASALLAYDGRAPVNVFAWLLYTAALPFALAVLLVAGLIMPARCLPRPGLAQALLGAVVEPLMLRLPDGQRWVRALWGRSGPGRRSLERWLLVGFTQVFTLAYLTAALATLIVMVSISDLTFSWSTTLNLSDQDVTKLVQAVAAPWRDIYPGAVPGEEAVTRSNYRRFVERFRDTDTRTAVEVAVGAVWWKMSAAAVLVYGILPRVLLLLLARWRWRRGLARWPDLGRPEVQNLLARLEDQGGGFAPRSTRPSPPPYGSPSSDLREAPAPPVAQAFRMPRHRFAVAWGAAAADPEAAAGALEHAPETLLTAGTDFDLSAEAAVLSAAAETAEPVTVLVHRQEPPVEDVISFLRELRSVVPRVLVVPVEPNGTTWRAVAGDPIWMRALSGLRGVEAPP